MIFPNPMNEFFLILGMALVTFLIRYPIIALSGRMTLSPTFLQLLSYVPPTVLTAIVVPAVLIPDGEKVLFSYTNARFIGAIVAVVVGLWRKNLLLTIVASMVVFFIWQWIVL
jgi:branched-subunit amino acid transport protein